MLFTVSLERVEKFASHERLIYGFGLCVLNEFASKRRQCLLSCYSDLPSRFGDEVHAVAIRHLKATQQTAAASIFITPLAALSKYRFSEWL